MATKREELIRRGYTIFPGVVPPALVAELSAAVNERVQSMDHYVRPDGLQHTRHKGDHLHLAFNRKVVERPMGGAGICHPAMAKLVAWPASLAALDEVGCQDKKFWSGYVLSKPAGGPPLYWHNDWSFWDDSVSADPMPQKMFGMVYLCDTTRENGCLRVVEGSHRRQGPVWHAVAGNNHLSRHKPKDEKNPASVMAAEASFEDEIFASPGTDLPMKAGDLLLGDSRLLHGTHPNNSNARRTCITLWYLSDFRSLSERVRVGFANEWEGESGREMMPGIDERGTLDPLIPRVSKELIGRSYPTRGGGSAVFPTVGAQDFLGENLPSRYWVEPPARM